MIILSWYSLKQNVSLYPNLDSSLLTWGVLAELPEKTRSVLRQMGLWHHQYRGREDRDVNAEREYIASLWAHQSGRALSLDHRRARPLDTFRVQGVPLSKHELALSVHALVRRLQLHANRSRWLDDGNVLRELGISRKVGQRTLNRALVMLGQHREEIIRRLWDGIQDSFELPDTDVNIDGSAVTVYGARSELSEHGYPRDKNPGKE